MDDKFVYKDHAKAMSDLELFSQMNYNEDRFLYLCAVIGGWVITKEIGLIVAIAFNGTVFTPHK